MSDADMTFDVNITYRCYLDALMLDQGDVSLTDHPEQLASWIEELLGENHDFVAESYSVNPCSITIRPRARILEEAAVVEAPANTGAER